MADGGAAASSWSAWSSPEATNPGAGSAEVHLRRRGVSCRRTSWSAPNWSAFWRWRSTACPRSSARCCSLYYYEELNLREIGEVVGLHLSRVAQLRTQAILQAAQPPGESLAVPAQEKRMNSQTLDVLLDIEMPVTVRFGSAQMTFGDVMGLNAGSVVEFDRGDGRAGRGAGKRPGGGPRRNGNGARQLRRAHHRDLEPAANGWIRVPAASAETAGAL